MQRILHAATVVVCLPIAGCLARGKFRPTHYYTLSVPEAKPVRREPLALTASIRPFTTVRRYDQRIVRRKSPVQLAYDEYHRWSEAPDELVGDVFARSLASRRLFKSVAGPALDVDTDVVIEGRVLTFEEDPKGNAICTLALALSHKRETRPLWIGTLTGEAPASGHLHPALAQAMSAAVQEVVDQCVKAWSGLPQLVRTPASP